MSYANAQQFKDLGLPHEAVSELDDVQIDDFLDAAAGFMDAYLASQYTVPITEPSGFLTRCNVDLAANDVLAWRGYNPEDGDEVYRERAERWIKILAEIRDGSLSVPNVGDGQGGDSRDGRAQASSQPLRGWSAATNKIGTL